MLSWNYYTKYKFKINIIIWNFKKKKKLSLFQKNNVENFVIFQKKTYKFDIFKFLIIYF